MTNQEAIKILDRIATRNMFCTLEQEQLEAFRIAIEALEKQIPKELSSKEIEEEIYNAGGFTKKVTVSCCPMCKCSILFGKYCPRCGQKLVWRKEEK